MQNFFLKFENFDCQIIPIFLKKKMFFLSKPEHIFLNKRKKFFLGTKPKTLRTYQSLLFMWNPVILFSHVMKKMFQPQILLRAPERLFLLNFMEKSHFTFNSCRLVAFLFKYWLHVYYCYIHFFLRIIKHKHLIF